MDEYEEYDGPDYEYYDDVDFSTIQLGFRNLPLFDDMYLNMQAMNVAMIDQFITAEEYALLREYIEIEKTPLEQALFVSAQSQMWIFALYELLRTWRQRLRKLIKWKENGALNEMLGRVQSDRHNLTAMMRARHIEWVRDDDDAVGSLHNAEVALDPVYQMTHGIRINLAKHEAPGKANTLLRAPGYGRINMLCGAMDFELDYGDNSYSLLNRRDIADALRAALPEERQRA